MVNRIGHGKETVDSEALGHRLRSLSNFQAMLLLHALRFPSVRRVVYSTCSVYERENELVIHDVLQSTSSKFRLVHVLPQFPGRGKSSTLLQASSCVRMSPETSLTVGFFIACLERVDDVPGHLPSSTDVGAQKVEGATVSESTTGEMQVESDPVSDERKSRKHKKSKKEKTTRLELYEPDATVVKAESSSELDGLPQKSQSEQSSFICEHTTDKMETETVGKSRKLHKRKKSKGEKSAKLARLEHSEIDSTAGLERLDHGQNSTDLLPTSDVIQTEQVTATVSRKSHKHKKSKKATSSSIVNQSEISTTVGSERLDATQTSSDVLPTSKLVQIEVAVAADTEKSHKHKKSKKTKASRIVEQSEIDTAAGLERLDMVHTSSDQLPKNSLLQTEEVIAADTKKSHKHKKSKKAKAETDIVLVKERLDSKFDSQSHYCLTENTSESNNNVVQAERTGVSRKLHRHKKAKKERHAKFMGPQHSVIDKTITVD